MLFISAYILERYSNEKTFFYHIEWANCSILLDFTVGGVLIALPAVTKLLKINIH